jgi:phosphatidylinositol-3-phosphatase
VNPNLCNDMHDCSVVTGDTWLKNQLKSYADWAKTHNSVLIVDFDEDDFTTTNRVPTAFTRQPVKTGTYPEPTTHYSVLRTIEDTCTGLPISAPLARDQSPTPGPDHLLRA